MRFFLFWSSFAAAVFAANLAIAKLALPDYATWTGIRPLEDKLRKLEKFASQGTVDFLILGSSIADRGVSAETLSRELEKQLGGSRRVFNFSTGGASLPTYPLLYRLARTVSIPKTVVVVQPAQWNIGEAAGPRSPEAALMQAPIGGVLRNRVLLRLSRDFWRAPLVLNASPLRDLALYGSFRSRVAGHSDLYELSAQGDTLDYGFNADFHYFAEQMQLRASNVIELAERYRTSSTVEDRRAIYFSNRDTKAVVELRELAVRDRVSLLVVAHDRACGFRVPKESYHAAHKAYFEELGQIIGVRAIDFLAEFQPSLLEVADSVHLNVYGARRFTTILAAKLAGKTSPAAETLPAPDISQGVVHNPTFSAFSSVVERQRREPGCWLELIYMQNWQTPSVTPGDHVTLGLRLPDNHDVICPARVLGPGTVMADTSSIPSSRGVLIARLLPASRFVGEALNVPLVRYNWLTCDQGLVLLRAAGFPDVTPEAEVLRPGVAAGVRWSGIRSPARDDWIGLFPVAGDDRSRVHFVSTGGAAAGTLQFPVPATAPAGDYEFRLYARGTWDRIATSKAIPIRGSIERPEAEGMTRAALETPVEAVVGEPLSVTWREIRSAASDDWVGLFPVKGRDHDRVTFVFTKGAVSGNARLPVPDEATPGLYELRYYAQGTWRLVATSRPFRIRKQSLQSAIH